MATNITSRFNEIYDSTYRAVVSFVTVKCGNTDDIKDLVQEIYLELYQLLNRRGADYMKNEKAVVLRIAKQKLSRHYSLLERFRFVIPMTTANEDGEEIDISELEAEAFLTEDFTVNKILLQEVERFIDQKPEDVKKVFYLFYYSDLSIAEIAQALSIGESNVKNKLYRTLKELRTLLN